MGELADEIAQAEADKTALGARFASIARAVADIHNGLLRTNDVPAALTALGALRAGLPG